MQSLDLQNCQLYRKVDLRSLKVLTIFGVDSPIQSGWFNQAWLKIEVSVSWKRNCSKIATDDLQNGSGECLATGGASVMFA